MTLKQSCDQNNKKWDSLIFLEFYITIMLVFQVSNGRTLINWQFSFIVFMKNQKIIMPLLCKESTIIFNIIIQDSSWHIYLKICIKEMHNAMRKLIPNKKAATAGLL